MIGFVLVLAAAGIWAFLLGVLGVLAEDAETR